MAEPTLHRFKVGEIVHGFAAPLAADRVGITFMVVGGPNFNMPMAAEDARRVANALYEAADASEKVLPVAPVAAEAVAPVPDISVCKPWLSGQPYYCKDCGAGGGEVMGCEMPNCAMESEADAQARRRRALEAA